MRENRPSGLMRGGARRSLALRLFIPSAPPTLLTVFTRPAAHQGRLRTTNALERVNMELKRRTRVAGLFPNEPSLLRLVSALLAEFSDEWETGKVSLNMECQTQPSV